MGPDHPYGLCSIDWAEKLRSSHDTIWAPNKLYRVAGAYDNNITIPAAFNIDILSIPGNAAKAVVLKKIIPLMEALVDRP